MGATLLTVVDNENVNTKTCLPLLYIENGQLRTFFNVVYNSSDDCSTLLNVNVNPSTSYVYELMFDGTKYTYKFINQTANVSIPTSKWVNNSNSEIILGDVVPELGVIFGSANTYTPSTFKGTIDMNNVNVYAALLTSWQYEYADYTDTDMVLTTPMRIGIPAGYDSNGALLTSIATISEIHCSLKDMAADVESSDVCICIDANGNCSYYDEISRESAIAHQPDSSITTVVWNTTTNLMYTRDDATINNISVFNQADICLLCCANILIVTLASVEYSYISYYEWNTINSRYFRVI